MSESKAKLKKTVVHPATRNVKFLCATCNSCFSILSTLNAEQVGIDVCSQCHPIYVGSGGQGKVRGRAERLAHRFIDKENSSEKSKKSF